VEPFSFDKLPEVIRQLFEKIERIELLLQNLQPQTAEDTLLTLAEAADFLKTSSAALYTKVSRGEIPFSKPGKRLYFNKDELKKWAKQEKK